jgi:ABC-type transport system involved in multi-copper enzyme maturation permease subunit
LLRRISPEVRNAVLVLVAALALALAPKTRSLALPIALFGLLLTAWAIRKRGAEAVGPMFFYDLMRLARRGRSTLLRCLYAALLLGGLYLIYSNRFPLEAEFRNLFRLRPKVRLEELAHFAGTFATAIFALQSAAVLVLTPAYVSGAIAEEKERRTLELLFTTHLSDREIVLGKLFGRLVHLFGVVLAGLPILMALQVWGGVEPLLPLAGFLVTVLTLLSVGGVCIYASVACRSSFAALIISYSIIMPVAILGVLIPGCFFTSPVAFMMSLEMQLGAGQFYEIFWPLSAGASVPGPLAGGGAGPAATPMSGSAAVLIMTLIYAVPHLLVAGFCGWGAIRSLRGSDVDHSREDAALRERRQRRREHREAERSKKRQAEIRADRGWNPVEIEPEENRVRLVQPLTQHVHHPMTDHPLLWKEMYHEAGEWARVRFRSLYPVSVAVMLILAFVILTLTAANDWNRSYGPSYLTVLGKVVNQFATPTMRVFTILLAAGWCMAAAWRTASSLTREREGRTLGALLTLPVERYAVLKAKWWGGILRLRWLGILLLALWTTAVLCGAFHPIAAVMLATAVAAHIAFLASIGVSLSLISRTTMWANFNMSLILLIMFAGSWVATAYYEVLFGGFGSSGEPDWWDDFLEVGLNPVRTWWYLGLNWEEFRNEAFDPERGLRGTLGSTLAGMSVYATLAILIWFGARRDFRKLDAV